jgi:hypothetical protein
VSFRLLMVAITVLGCGLVCAAAPAPTIPDTPAGHTLGVWLDAFNSGDRARVESFLKTYAPQRDLDSAMALRVRTGGFDLIAIEESAKERIVFRLQERLSSAQTIGTIQVRDADPPVISDFILTAVSAGDKNEQPALDAAARARVIEGAINKLIEFYVFSDVAKKMADALRSGEKRGAYDALVDGDSFASALTRDLQSVSHDRHLRVGYNPAGEQAGRSPESEAAVRKFFEKENCGFETVGHLSPNIGYVKFRFFADPDICAATASAAMNLVAGSDALILDLRENGGGQPSMIAFISSYLFAEPTHLNDLYNRKENTTTQYWTMPYVPGRKFLGKPVFVLTSHHTFSGAEEFSYNLKNLKRATLIGETTGGGAHPTGPQAIDDRFTIYVPFARAINPITKTNWEGVGVEPDVKVPAEDALTEALKRARE